MAGIEYPTVMRVLDYQRVLDALKCWPEKVLNGLGVHTSSQVVNPKYTQVSRALLSPSDRLPTMSQSPTSHCLALIKPDLDVHHGG